MAVDMIPYHSYSGKNSGVSAYKIEDDSILVEFNHTTVYKYSYASCGKHTTEKMKTLALSSEGLSTFIAQKNPAYEWKK